MALRVVGVQVGLISVEGKHAFRLYELFKIGQKNVAMAWEVGETSALLSLLAGTTEDIAIGDAAFPLDRALGVAFAKRLLGRVISPLGEPLDGLPLKHERMVELFTPPVPFIERGPVERTLHTGVNAIDWAVPLALGQRELVIGDAQTGKTSLALAIVKAQRSQGVACIYVSIGQKATSVASLVEELRDSKASEYTLVVAAPASAGVSERYAAPYAGMALAEQWAKAGSDVLVVFDDLTKHAEAYREVALQLQHAPGREAYPGDIFYAHSSLLERAGAFGAKHGNGSITAIPLAQTQDGEIASYIPTNLIAITDGQIYLDRRIFFEGRVPAIDLGLSVSRIGPRAQVLPVRELAQNLKVDIAVFEDLKSFMRFTSSNVAGKMGTAAILPGLLKQSQDEMYSPGASALLLALYRRGFFDGVKDPARLVDAVKAALFGDEAVRATVDGTDVSTMSADAVFELGEALFGPLAKAVHDTEAKPDRRYACYLTDRRLYERFYR